MKVMIDIPQDHKRVIDNLVSDGKGYLLPYEVETGLARAVKIGTVIPDDATNGEVIMAMFPNAIIRIVDNEGFPYIEMEQNDSWIADSNIDFWNAPYKK